MSNTNTGGPAFPAPAGVAHITDQGMTLRDYFAAKAMQGLLAGKLQSVELKVIAGDCYKMADAMLKAREA
jgi:hypothetical protein